MCHSGLLWQWSAHGNHVRVEAEPALPAGRGERLFLGREFAAEKEAYAVTRRQRWFGIDPHVVPVA